MCRQNWFMILKRSTGRFVSLNAPETTDGSCTHGWEVTDTMRTIAGLASDVGLAVTRTYTLRVRSKNFPKAAHITGWDRERGDWIYDEPCWRELDWVLAEAGRYQVHLIIPIINQGRAVLLRYTILCLHAYRQTGGKIAIGSAPSPTS